MSERKLLPRKFDFYSLKEIIPTGYLYEQLRIQAEGLSGNLQKFWPDIMDSKWIGGDCEGWERVPYWLDGFIPLVFLLNDEELKKDAKRYIDSIISQQKADGWICPCQDNERGNYDVWAVFLLLKVLTVWHDATGDERVYNVIYSTLKNLSCHINGHVLFGWAQMRWFEGLISIFWLAERCDEEWILQLCDKLKCQGFDYHTFFKNWPYEVIKDKDWSQMNHVVNNAMMLKGDSLYYLATGESEYLTHADFMLNKLDKYHGMVTGAFTGDECLSGDSPVQGTELCAIAEFMYSCEQLMSVTGDIKWGDRLERLAFNSLFATFSPDMWAHQYDQQVNQVMCVKSDEPIFNTNNGEANLFGLEPHFGCCTSNLSQPLPKYILSSFMRAEDGIAVINLSPCMLRTECNGVNTKISVEGEYPFSESVGIKVDTQKPVKLYIRIPEFCTHAEYVLNGICAKAESGKFLTVSVENKAEISLTLKSDIKLVKRPRDMVSIVKGGMVYSMRIASEWTRINEDIKGREFPHCDYEVRPKEDWNYAIVSDNFVFENKFLNGTPFAPNNAPNKILVKMKKIGWGTAKASCLPVPDGEAYGEIIEREFIPYCCTDLRLTETKLLKENK